MTRATAAPLPAKLAGLLIVVLTLAAVFSPALAYAAGGNVKPDPSPQPAAGTASGTPSPDPAPQATSSSSQSSTAGAPAAQPVVSSSAPAQPAPSNSAPARPATSAPSVVPTPAGPGIGLAQGGGEQTSHPAAPVARVIRVPLAHRPRKHATRHVRRLLETRVLPRPTSVPVPWRGPDPLDVQSAMSLPTVSASPRKSGVLLLAGAGALALLVLASGAMLRVLVRMESKLGV